MGAARRSAAPTCRLRGPDLLRRTFLCGLAGFSLLPAALAAQEGSLLAASQKRLLRETAHAQLLSQAEISLTGELQRRVDSVKAELNAEEAELARLRGEMDRDVFERRVAMFDKRVRDERRRAQRYATNLQNALRAERLKLVEALGPLLEAVRQDHGALAIVNADNALAFDPAIDVTDEVISRFDAEVPQPVIPDLDVLAAEPETAPNADGGAPGSAEEGESGGTGGTAEQ